MTGVIYIPGKDENGVEMNAEIGSRKDEKGNFVRGVELIDVIQQVAKLPEDTKILQVNIKGPGGRVDVGDAIYDYLESLKKKYTVNTVQVGDLGSISTKIWGVGQDRKRDPQFGFIIHNPWNNPGPGDSKYQAAQLESLLLAEEALRKFYMKLTGLTSEALEPLMDVETDLTAQQCIDLKFATSLTLIPVMASVKKDDKKLSFDERIAAVRAAITGKKEKAEVKALDLPLADGRVLVSDAADMSALEGSMLTIDGAPAPVFEYQLADGSVVSVTEEGKAGKYTPKVEDKAPETNARFAKIEENLGKLTDLFTDFITSSKEQVSAAVKAVEEKSEKELTAKIMALKSEIGTTHLPKPGAVVYAKQVDKEQTELPTNITERLKIIGERKNKA